MTLRWVRLFWLLAALGGAGVLVIHNQTTVVTTGYRISEKIDQRERSRERNRMLRIDAKQHVIRQVEGPDRTGG